MNLLPSMNSSLDHKAYSTNKINSSKMHQVNNKRHLVSSNLPIQDSFKKTQVLLMLEITLLKLLEQMQQLELKLMLVPQMVLLLQTLQQALLKMLELKKKLILQLWILVVMLVVRIAHHWIRY